MFDDYEVDHETERGMKSDSKEHPRTSSYSLRSYARGLNTMATDVVKRKEVKAWMKDPHRRAPNKAQYWTKRSPYAVNQEEELQTWLQSHEQDLPRELEDEQGRQYHSSFSSPEVAGGNREYTLMDDTGATVDGDDANPFAQEREIDYSGIARRAADRSVWEEHGKSYLGERACYYWDAQLAREIGYTDPEYRKHIRTYGLTRHARRVLRAHRARLFKAHQERQEKKFRWRGMEEWDAVGKATAHQEEGKSRTKDVSNAKPLPDLGRLHELFRVEDGKLVNKRLDRVVKRKQVVVDGEQHSNSRVVYAIQNGEDPGSKMVRDGTASHYRKATGAVRFDRNTDGVTYREARVKLGDEAITVGKYADRIEEREDGTVRTINVAYHAAKLYIKSLEMGL